MTSSWTYIWLMILTMHQIEERACVCLRGYMCKCVLVIQKVHKAIAKTLQIEIYITFIVPRFMLLTKAYFWICIGFFLDLKAVLCIFKVWSFISVRSFYLRYHATCILILDSGYFDNQSYKVLIPTAWIPLLDTDEFNGGMQVSHPV